MNDQTYDIEVDGNSGSSDATYLSGLSMAALATAAAKSPPSYEVRLKALQRFCAHKECSVIVESARNAKDRKMGWARVGIQSSIDKMRGLFRMPMTLDSLESELLNQSLTAPWTAVAERIHSQIQEVSKSHVAHALAKKPNWLPDEMVTAAVEQVVLKGRLPWSGAAIVEFAAHTSWGAALREACGAGWVVDVVLHDGDDSRYSRTIKVTPGQNVIRQSLWGANVAATPLDALTLVKADITQNYIDGYETWRDEAMQSMMGAQGPLPAGLDGISWHQIVAQCRLEIGVALLQAPGDWDQQLKVHLKQLRKRLDWRGEALQLECAAMEARAALPEQLKDFYPVARRIGRRLKLIVGPTNSGKTHAAMERLLTAESGAYLGPLRLLALELRDRLTEAGAPTSLVTGELIEEVEGARLSASTIEMLDFKTVVDVVVIDEVQMLSDPQRGGVWLQAVLGAPGREVWMLGSPESRGMVEQLALELGEPLEVIQKQRLTPFTVDTHPTPIKRLPKGSAVIVFSRREALAFAAQLRERQKRTVAVIYGALSPEVRKEQARSFREGECEILVSTDAIGMGLNLPIGHIYFSTAVKWNGKTEESLDPHLLWQIAGRAGRFGQFEAGTVGALDDVTLRVVKRVMAKRPAAYEGLLSFEANAPIVGKIAEVLKTQNLSDALMLFSTKFKHMAAYKPYVSDEAITLASKVDALQLTLEERFSLIHAPVNFRSGVPDAIFDQFALALSLKKPCAIAALGLHSPSFGLEAQEAKVKQLALYSWMHYRFPDVFPDLQAAQLLTRELEQRISTSLTQLAVRKCPSCQSVLDWNHRFPSCDRCFRSSDGY